MRRVFILLILLLFISVMFVLTNINNEEKLIIPADSTSKDSTFNDIEQNLYELIKKQLGNQETKTETLNSIKGINWAKLDTKKAIEILDWIDINIPDSETDITSILKATNGLDGAVAEKYSNIVAKLYLEDKYKFIKCLSALSEKEIESICGFAAYGCSYFDLEQIIEDTNSLMLTEKLSEQEKTVTQRLIVSFSKIKS